MIIAGFGFRRSATLESLQDAYARATDGCDATAIATLRDKADCAAFEDLAHALALPVYRICPEDARAMKTPTQSAASQSAYDVGSVAEAAALAAAGPGAALLRVRVISKDHLATCALAQRHAGESGAK